MTVATLVTDLAVNNPVEETLILSGSHGDTYTSKKFGKVIAGQATLMEDTSTLSIPISLAFSSPTVTIHCSGAAADTILASKYFCLTLYGNK